MIFQSETRIDSTPTTWGGLLKETGLESKLENDMVNNQDLARNWNVVKEWKETSRYQRKGLNGKDLYKAVTGTTGVLPWIKNHW